MKKISMFFLSVILVLMLVSCDNQEMTFVSMPVGYALMEDTYVAKASFNYYSEEPYNVNNIMIEYYDLPSLWAEITIGEDQQLLEDNPYFLIFDYDTPNQKVYAKFIQIGTTYWTGVIDGDKVNYMNEDNIDIITFLTDEQEAKWYYETAENNDAHFLDNDRTWLSGYYSKLDILNSGNVFQKVLTEQLIIINWDETLTSFPDLSEYYPEFEVSDLETLFQRVFAKAEEEEFIILKEYI